MENKKKIDEPTVLVVVFTGVIVMLVIFISWLSSLNSKVQSNCHGLVGTWNYDGEAIGTYKFNSDGSGRYGVGDYDLFRFIYKDHGSYATIITIYDGYNEYRMDYKITDNGHKLLIQEDGRQTSFVCAE